MDRTDADIGLIGLAVMGQNIALNIDEHGYRVTVYNRTSSVTDDFIAGPASATSIRGVASLERFVASLAPPRRIILMVQAGGATDSVIGQLTPLLAAGDIIIDCGNSHFADSERRGLELKSRGIHFVGSGVSGGEEGARNGPSIMPGGAAEAWPHVQPVLQSIAAKVDGEPCCDWIGNGGAGHFVKMVHNGIEYGDMQLIAETYHLLYHGLGLDHDEMAAVFRGWNEGDLDSYLVQITADILGFRDADGEPLLDRILDAAGQKGTGKWTGMSALELGVPVSLIGEAVFARCLSALKEQRVQAAGLLDGPDGTIGADRSEFVADLGRALYAAKVVSYAQGFMLMREASIEHEWALRPGPIASLWRGGCIIRSRFLRDIRTAFDRQPDLECLLLDDHFRDVLAGSQSSWRKVVAAAATAGIPVPALGAGLSFYDGYRSQRLSANLLQAQRDYFGGHTYERIDRPRGEFFHTDWTGRGGSVSSRTYNV